MMIRQQNALPNLASRSCVSLRAIRNDNRFVASSGCILDAEDPFFLFLTRLIRS